MGDLLRRHGSVLALAYALLACEREAAPPPPPPAAAAPEVPGAAPAPAAVAEEPEPEAEPEPALPGLAYEPTHIESVRVLRAGRSAMLTTRLTRVEGARRYQLQIASDASFDAPLLERLVSGTSARLGPILAGVVYMRARALGPNGVGPYGQVCVVDASRTGAPKPVVVNVAAATEPSAPVLTQLPEPPPPRPRPSTRDTKVWRAKYEKLKKELDGIASLRAELQASITSLQARLVGADATTAEALRAELASIEATRTQLDREIAAGMAELEASPRP